MRIIAGKHKGRRIAFDKHSAIRPTSDFARQAMFNILLHGLPNRQGAEFIGNHVLDLCCGTGAFGLEALSRGAGYVTFIDQSRQSLQLARQNATQLGEADHCAFIQADATRLPRATVPAVLVFIDPPYFAKLLAPAMQSLHHEGWLAPHALVLLEHDEKEAIDIPPLFKSLDLRRYGRAAIEILEYTEKQS